ncbi:DNA-binding protein [Aquabacterium olei]|uniref:DNA-binding protein n=1 Tax=Aquabacterium olei TaxID=1296669 RepID=A0A2U8FWN6_9BURK|nr:PLP-dependent aminotransferase family protein [Aquabacterium olei]AWI54844.1 DNA-binding protein [Aquabacterium olei]
MKTTALSDWLQQRLRRDGSEPVYRQLQQLLRQAVISGELPAHTRLPSSRLLAQELGIARNTVIDVYEQLAVEGCVVSRQGSGTVVADLSAERLPTPTRARSARGRGAGAEPGVAAGAEVADAHGAAQLSPRGEALLAAASVSTRQWGAFMPGVPDVTEFPARTWMRLENRRWRHPEPELLSYAPGGGLPRLREALAAHLRTARSVVCEPEQLILTTGSHQSIDLTLRLLASPGEHVWLEDPCYWGLRSSLASLEARIVPVPVDAEGLAWQDGGPHPVPRAILVTPSHQYPLGMVMSLARRQALLAYARTHGSWIIEDDYDSEFRYGTRPLPALQGLDDAGRVIYVGSLSKVLFPGLRLGYLVVPPALAERFALGSAALYREGQAWQQATLADFIEQGHLGSHIRRMRGLYHERRQALLEAIRQHFGDTLAVRGDDAGLHLVLALPDHVDDVALARDALAAGVAVRPLSRYHADPARAPRGLLLGYACVRPEAIPPAFAVLARQVAARLGG